MSTTTSTTIPPTDSDHWLSGMEPDQVDAQVIAAIQKPVTGAVPVTTSWEIGAYVMAGENEEINTYAREELATGAEALLFRLYHQPNVKDIAEILAGIPIEKISLHCSLRYPGQDPAELFRDLVRYLRREGHDLRQISGSVDFDPLLDWSEPPFPPLIRLLFFVARWMPAFRVLQVNAAGFNNGIAEADGELALALAKGAEYLKQIKDRGYPVALANRHLKFAFTLGTSFHGDVAKLRAFRILWSRVLEDLGVANPPLTQISAHTDISTLQEQDLDNDLMLRLQAVAANLGGADLLFLAPADGMFEEATQAGRQRARDIQNNFRKGVLHASVNEGYLEDLTVALVKAAWLRYKHIQDQGGFANATDF
ncbi:MAG: methylmalonyl-CoA mutase family protein [Bacteroidota bacterium]